MEKLDYIIVGQGIAGTMLSWFLIKAGKRIKVVDPGKEHTSSRIAGGIINPVTGKRIVKTWMAEELLGFAKTTYREMEKEVQREFYTENPILKIMANAEMKEQWCKRLINSELEDWVEDGSSFPYSDFFNCEHGFYRLNGATVDSIALLDSFRNYLDKMGSLKEDRFDPEELEVSENGVKWKDMIAAKIIFCQGSVAAGTGYFGFIPFVLAKGEILTVKTENRINHLVNNQVYVWQEHREMWKVGATYEWNFEDENPSEKGKANLVSRLKKMYNSAFEVVDHQAAVRPTIVDRRPVIGLHPEYPQLGIFNGLGTKGFSLAPNFAKHFVEHLESGMALNSEVNIERFNREKD